ncbi:hypothetical protein PS9374_06213 [Planomonospora sphaerica]|uniref:Uncharacterized protein n=1 Tax=Planomonospora sphaerica TaxID=161355 RepID=A0A161LMU3_9ACTN|nr:hypothetical protein [Planomonospora sphaerica]GAT70527.1 hypothetical protein PS9374_06213 [Planomonospora sphaerica]
MSARTRNTGDTRGTAASRTRPAWGIACARGTARGAEAVRPTEEDA